MWVSIILNETDITIIIIIMMVMIMMEEVAKSVILFHAQVFKGSSVNFHYPLIRAKRLKLLKEARNKDILRLGGAKTKK